MKKSIEVLRKHGVIEKMQDSFNHVKPPKGTSDETILAAIQNNIEIEMMTNEDIQDELCDALTYDLAECVRNELSIEYVNLEDFNPMSLLADMFRDLADSLENGKGKGEE